MTTVAWLIALAATFVVAFYAGVITAAVIVGRRDYETAAHAQRDNPGSATWTDHA